MKRYKMVTSGNKKDNNKDNDGNTNEEKDKQRHFFVFFWYLKRLSGLPYAEYNLKVCSSSNETVLRLYRQSSNTGRIQDGEEVSMLEGAI